MNLLLKQNHRFKNEAMFLSLLRHPRPIRFWGVGGRQKKKDRNKQCCRAKTFFSAPALAPEETRLQLEGTC
jgi:hypothetical protein